MSSTYLTLFLSVMLFSCAHVPSPSRHISSDWPDLSNYDMDAAPWLHIEANSEQRGPVYLGASPRELALGIRTRGEAVLPDWASNTLQAEAKKIREALIRDNTIQHQTAIEFEVWPVRNDDGQIAWAFARWRTEFDAPWTWIDLKHTIDYKKIIPAFTPTVYRPSSPAQHAFVFNDVLEQTGLYDKPLFGDCVWTTSDGEITRAWLPTNQRAEMAKSLRDDREICRLIPRPARLNGTPVTFSVLASPQHVLLPQSLIFRPHDHALETVSRAPVISAWPTSFETGYRNDVAILSGESDSRFVKKNSIDPENQLMALCDYLQERYSTLGIQTVRQNFSYHSIPQCNVIAIIPGTDPNAKPVLMADHIDTAFCQDVYDKTKKREATAGADDNISATSVLLQGAPVLKSLRLKHPIWAVHLTGEEFPADDLGARYFISELLKNKTDIAGLVLLDMIAYRKKGDRVFQINAGDSQESLHMASVAMDAAKPYTTLNAAFRHRFDERSYLYNTDGLIFSDAGHPVILFNEHINALENMSRTGYHDTTDTVKKIDWAYASSIAKIAIETVARLAQED